MREWQCADCCFRTAVDLAGAGHARVTGHAVWLWEDTSHRTDDGVAYDNTGAREKGWNLDYAEIVTTEGGHRMFAYGTSRVHDEREGADGTAGETDLRHPTSPAAAQIAEDRASDAYVIGWREGWEVGRADGRKEEQARRELGRGEYGEAGAGVSEQEQRQRERR